MKKLPLYTATPVTSITGTAPAVVDHDCALCQFSVHVNTVCMNSDGSAGGLLVVGDFPTKLDDQVGTPFAGLSGKYLRGVIKRWWSAPVMFDNAIRCAPGITKVQEKHIDACRQYSAQVLQDTDPTRIVVLGSIAAAVFLDRKVYPLHARRGYGWVAKRDGTMTPVFYVLNPALAARNRFMAQAFEADLKWALTTPTPSLRFKGVTYLVENAKDAKVARADLASSEFITYDVETFGKMGNGDFRIEACTLLGNNGKHAYTWSREALQDPICRVALKKVLESKPVIGQNVKYDDRSVYCYLNAEVGTAEADTRLFRKLLDFETPASLDVLAELAGMGGHKGEAHSRIVEICKELMYQANPPAGATPTGRVRKVRPAAFHVPQGVLDQLRAGAEPMAFAYGFLDEDVLYRYNARDVFSTRAVYRKLKPRLDAEPGIRRTWDAIVRDASRAVRWIEIWGFAIDKTALQNFATYCIAKETHSLRKIQSYGVANPASPIQLREFLFAKLGLPQVKETDTGLASTDAEVLLQLKGKHVSIEAILEWRKFQKLNSTYATGMLPHIRDDGRIHTSYLLDGAGTGRLSSADPNMQNIPRAKGNQEGKMLRECFIAPAGYVLIEADQSQVELRVAAMLSNDPVMIDDYKRGIDIHANNARECCDVAWGISREKWDKMTKDERDPYRSQIKTSTFGRLYGKTDRGLAHEFGVDVRVIEQINKKIWGRYKRLTAWIQERIVYSRRTGMTWTWWDGQDARRRQIWGIGDADDVRRAHAERTAYNTAVQGTAADFTTASLWPLVSWILDEGVPAKVVATIHDSIIIEAHKTVVSETIAKMNSVMTGWPTVGGMPLVAEFKTGPNWGSMEDYSTDKK